MGASRWQGDAVMRNRRIILDISMARGGGGFTYAVNVIPVLARKLPETDLLVVLSNARIAESLPRSENLSIHLIPESGFLGRLRHLTFTAPALARSWGADLYYSASEISPFRCPCPKVAAFRNATLFTDIELRFPWSQRIRVGILRALAVESVRTCSKILFVSRDSAQWIGDRLGVPPERRVVVPHGVNPDLWSASSGSSPFEREFILSVGSIYHFKNFVRLIEAWTSLARAWPGIPDLVIVGDIQDPAYRRAMSDARGRAASLADRIHIVGEVPYADVARYYRHAKAFVFPSYLETFGHPLLEAMAAGIPVIASDILVFQEIGGDAAVYFSAHDTESLASSLELVLRDPRKQAALIARGFSRLAEYSWDRTADGMISMFDEVLAQSAGE
jgi:glycosyltransferase involved in cell wall biosynthesis